MPAEDAAFAVHNVKGEPGAIPPEPALLPIGTGYGINPADLELDNSA
jgi:hypothetical protein